jgi:hypothetical protein
MTVAHAATPAAATETIATSATIATNECRVIAPMTSVTRTPATTRSSTSPSVGGTGVGLATGAPRVYADEVKINPGMAATPVHVHFELGGVASRSFHLVPFLRAQLVILETGIEPQLLAGLKARYFFADRGPLRAYAEGGLGYGNVSHLVYLADKDAYDTTIEGPFHVGAGIGLLYMFNDTVGLQNQVYTMAMFDQFSFQLDYSLGLYFAF